MKVNTKAFTLPEANTMKQNTQMSMCRNVTSEERKRNKMKHVCKKIDEKEEEKKSILQQNC